MQRIAKRIDEAQELTVFVVGDSITEGSRATSPDNNYIAVFAKCLAERYADCDCRVERYDGKRHPTPDAETLPLLRYDGPFTVREGDGKKITVTEVQSDQAFFTLCQSKSGAWFFFDETDEALILYSMNEDFSNKQVIKTVPLSEAPCSLKESGMTIMDNRIYFYSIPNNSTATVVYRYDIN